MTAQRHPAMWIVLVLTMMTVAGHVCELPGHADAATAGPADHDQGGGAALHAASCEATVAARPAPRTLVVTSKLAVPHANGASTFGWVSHLIHPVPTTGSPPLFLLHASLLI